MRLSKSSSLPLTVLAVAAFSLAGCATKDFVRQQTGLVDAKLQTTQSQVSAHDERLVKLDQATRDALDRAQAAGKLAEGKFLYAVVLSDDSVKFARNGADLSPEAQTRLQDFAQKLKADNRNVYLEIQGHTDSSGKKARNAQLGEARAESVRRFMNQQGVALNRMSTISYGAESPTTTNDTPEGRAQNRRVVVVVLN